MEHTLELLAVKVRSSLVSHKEMEGICDLFICMMLFLLQVHHEVIFCLYIKEMKTLWPVVWRNIVKLRCCNHKLEIETGRYAGIDRDLRYCGKCAMNIIGDEYHVFFECSNANISLQRNRFIPTYFRQNRSMFNFVKLLQSVDDIKVGRCVSSFVTNSNIV